MLLHQLPTTIVAQVALQPLVHYLGLSVRLRMVASARCQLCAHQAKELLPKSAHEVAIPVTDDGLWETMQPENVPKE